MITTQEALEAAARITLARIMAGKKVVLNSSTDWLLEQGFVTAGKSATTAFLKATKAGRAWRHSGEQASMLVLMRYVTQ